MKKIFLSAVFMAILLIADDVIAQNCSQPNSLTSVTKRKSGRTEYIIFDLKRPTNVSPTVQPAKPPFTEDPSGKTLTIKGCRYKKVRFNDLVWQCTISENFSNSTYLIQQVKKTGQFEGIIEYVIVYRCNTRSITSYSYNEGSLKKFVVRLK